MSKLSAPLAILDRYPPAKRIRKRAKWARVRASYHAHQRFLGNPSSSRRFVDDPPELTGAQGEVLAELRSSGLAIVDFARLIEDDALWQQLSASMESFVDEAESSQVRTDAPRTKDEYLIRRGRRIRRELERQGVRPPWPTLSLDDPWLRYALSTRILDVVNTYRGMWTKLLDLDQWYTVPFGNQHDRVASQNWHRDPEDLHVVKVFTYFSDVDDGAGPFQYIPESAEGGRYGHHWPWTVTGETYPSPEELSRVVPESQIRSARGPAGTVIFCDTSGFHRGGFATSRPRVLSYQTYVSPASPLSGRETRKFHVDVASANGSLPESVRFAAI